MTAVVGYAQLWAASPHRWRGAAAGWRSLAAWAGRRAAEFPGHAAALGRGWSGGAARVAGARVAALRLPLEETLPCWWEVDQVLSGYAAELTRAKALLLAAVVDVERAGLAVDRDGRVVPTPPTPGPTVPAAPGPLAAREATAAIAAALRVAARADADAAARLGELAGAVGGAGPTRPPPWRPACGAEPVAVHRWWTALTAAERRWLVVHEAGLVGRLDGVPVADRDRANRLLLHRRGQQLAADRAAAAAAGDGPGMWRLGRLSHSLDLLAQRLAADDGRRGYLVSLDPAGDGRAVVALGDPDRAGHVLTHVPGMTADLAGFDGELERARRVADRASELDPAARTAAVLWLDYDAPDFLDEAATATRARAAGPALHAFQEGLRATHDGPPARQTVLGHSYGSLVVGATAASHGLAADSVVFVGSPGVGVGAAGELGLPPGQLWSTTARTDVIQHLPAGLLGALAGVDAGPFLGAPRAELWHGGNPSHPGFGARVFASQADAGHAGYWDTDGPALDSLARIMLGGRHADPVR